MKMMTEPLWWGRGAKNCLAVTRHKNGPYTEIFIGNGKTQEVGPAIHLADDEFQKLIDFLQDVHDGKEMKNG